MRDKLMFIWWRAWHHRNNLIFGDGKASIQNSVNYLQNYLATLHNLEKGSYKIDRKRKAKQEQNTSTKDKSWRENTEKNEPGENLLMDM
jgi:hypothetical protein